MRRFFRTTLAAGALVALPAAANAACTEDQSIDKMTTIIASSEYSDLMANAGRYRGESAETSVARSGSRNIIGGRVGGSLSNMLGSADRAKRNQERNDGRALRDNVRNRMQQAEKLADRGKYAASCKLYDGVITDLGL